MTNLQRSLVRLRVSRDPAYGMGDSIRRCVGSRERALYAVGVFVLLTVCACSVQSHRTTCLDLDAACSSAVAQNLSHAIHEPQVCHYVADGRPVESSQDLECRNPQGAVTYVRVGENGAWGTEIQRMPGKKIRIMLLSGCVPGGMC